VENLRLALPKSNTEQQGCEILKRLIMRRLATPYGECTAVSLPLGSQPRDIEAFAGSTAEKVDHRDMKRHDQDYISEW
jgi:hypothetical protein